MHHSELLTGEILRAAFEIQKVLQQMTDKGVINIEAFSHWMKARFLNCKPQGVSDSAESTLFWAVSHSYYGETTHAAHLRKLVNCRF